MLLAARPLARWVFLAALLAGVTSVAAPPIDPQALLEHIKVLAADEVQGRGNGSAGLERAGDYIAQQFKAAGLQPAGANGDWFQPFGLTAGLRIADGNTLVIRAGTQDVRLSLGESYFPLAVTASDDVSGYSMDLTGVPIVFGGYGIAAPSADYDDYARLDVTGKAVLIFSHEPQENRSDSRL